MPETFLYVGTYTKGESEGIYIYQMDPAKGTLRYSGKATDVDNPSYLAVDPRRRCLYAVSETSEYQGRPGGSVSAFHIDPSEGSLKFLNRKPSLGADPCYLSIDNIGGHVLVANYSGGSVTVLPASREGLLGDSSDHIQHAGCSVNQQRQKGPHPHSIILDPAERYAFVPDLGLDRIVIYRFDPVHGKLTANDHVWVQVRAGAGPRHLDFHPNGGYAYLINELDSTIIAYAYDHGSGTLTELQAVPALPKEFSGRSHCADIHVTPSGRFLYGSNRGHDSIVIYSLDEGTGRLAYVGHESTRGKTPRNFVIDPQGKFLLVANQDTDTIVTFHIDQATGKLESTGSVIDVPTPVCLKMLTAQ